MGLKFEVQRLGYCSGFRVQVCLVGTGEAIYGDSNFYTGNQYPCIISGRGPAKIDLLWVLKSIATTYVGLLGLS